ncbi:cytochrome c1 [Curvibacter sp. CHRR-16]|uniref:cytochrome c1 n=1 Tax=Curvibacter sp. CHRR-16 TaxID=2835872 RepID=UPI001BDAD440|nr:cytochrome c1 [Curvibacter sp. CHRR-16]MBT0569406.1 cytochrome c1 [Curvibacter sp. CHRR-16]
MKKIIVSAVAALGLVMAAQANTGGFPLDKAPINLQDQGSLQNGARLFVNYCLSCHSAAFMRFNRLKDIGLTEQQIKDNLLFTTDKVGETMKASIDPKQAKEWFGANPPDLTLIARSRDGLGGSGADYLYTYMRTFYVDPSRPSGWNNMVFPNVGMPHALWELQGKREAVFEVEQAHGQENHVFKGWKPVTEGSMTPEQYDRAVADLVNYLQWMGEPAQEHRQQIGKWVLLFLAGLIFITWRLNAAFWKDVK